MEIKHKVIKAKDTKELETKLNKWAKEQWMPSCNPVPIGTDIIIVLSKQIIPKAKNVN